MSRIGKKPVAIPDGVKVAVDGQTGRGRRPQGETAADLSPGSPRSRLDDADPTELSWSAAGDDRDRSSLPRTDPGPDPEHGDRRRPKAIEKRLEIVGVGYLASDPGRHRSRCESVLPTKSTKKIPAGLNVTCPDQTHVVVQGCDKQLVGQFAAEVRAVRKPEPYKGKGVRYEGEYVKIKPGKAAT